LLLAAVNIDPNARDQNGTTALCSACKNGHISIVKQLLARGDVHLNTHGSHRRLTPLTAACFNNHTEIINLLLSKEGIDVNLRRNLDGETALHLTVSWNHLEAVKLLLEREDIDINLPNINGRTPLHQAVRDLGRNITMVNLLLGKKGIDTNVKDNEGNTPLAMACMGHFFEDNTSIVGLLLSHCNTDPNPVDNNGVSALTKVIRNDVRGFLRLFKEDHEKNREEIKSLICAAVRGHQDVPKSWP
jgi:ankyrin repeat protein